MNPRRYLALLVLGIAAIFLGSCCTCAQLEPESPSYEAATFEIEGNIAHMYGVIDHTTPEVVEGLVTNHPEVQTIIMMDVPGSADDPANLRAARMVRDHGLNTVVPSNAVIASGGVDFFLAGVERTAEGCAKLGVHDWEDEDENDVTVRGAEVPRGHEMHTKFLHYYQYIGVPEEFYWFTLKVAPPERIHWMSEEEIGRFGLTTGTGS